MCTNNQELAEKAALVALQLPIDVIEPGSYFKPEKNHIYKCANNKFVLIVRKDKKYGLIGWLIEFDSNSLDTGYLLAEGALEKFGEFAGEPVITSHRGTIFVTDDCNCDYPSIGTRAALCSIAGVEMPIEATC
jgi:hypothetical protein